MHSLDSAATNGEPPNNRVLSGLILGLGTATSMFTVMALAARILQVRTTSLTPAFPVGDWIISDLGSNLTTAALLSVGGLVTGLVAWALGSFRWAAGLISGSAFAVLGWAALVIGLVGRPINIVQTAVSNAAPVGTEAFAATIQRSAGFSLVALAASCALVTAILAGSQLRPDPRGGLNPWVAALGAVAAMGVAIGPLLPVGTASFTDNLAVTAAQPASFVIGRIVHLLIIAICGVGGFLMVRTAGLGVLLGNLVLIAWLTASAVLEVGLNPIGPGFTNPGHFDPNSKIPLEIHTVTLIGTILFAFMTIWACCAAVIRHLTRTPDPQSSHAPSAVTAP